MLWKFYHPPGITADGHTYLQIARNIQLGIGLGWQALWAAPLPSIIIAIVDSALGVHDLLRTAGILAPLMGFIMTASVYFLAVGLFGQTVAVVASLVTAVTPHLLAISYSMEPEIYYTFFLVTALGLLNRALTCSSLLYASTAGVMFCCAYMSRSEGFLIMVLTAVMLLISQGKQMQRSSLLRVVTVMLVFFFITASPYLLFLKKNYGTFVISPKATYVMIWMKWRIYHDNDKGEQGNEDLWGLTPQGKLKWQVPSGIGDLASYLLQDPKKSARVYLKNLRMELPGNIPNNSGMLHFPNVFPIYLAIFAGIALFFSWGESSRRKKATITAPFLILLILPVFTEGWWKYLVPYAPLMLILATAGVVFSADKIQRFFPTRRSIATSLVAICTVSLMTYYMAINLGYGAKVNADAGRTARLNYADEARKAGLWAAATFGPGKNYMVAWNKMIYYLNGLWTPEPVAGAMEIYKFAASNHVDLFVKEVFEPGISDVDLKSGPPGFKLAQIYRSDSPDYRVAFYQPLYK